MYASLMTSHYIKYPSLDQKLTLNTADTTALVPLDFVGKSARQTDGTYYTTNFVDDSGTNVAKSESLDLQGWLANLILQLTLLSVSLHPPITRSSSFPLESIACILAFCTILDSIHLYHHRIPRTLDFPLLRIYLL
jgi:hypothetical protein